ncbi:flavodoxin [Listeria ilorinensis]|uniref:flavodoxin n=1 Tax=Listeria ilorinensis TaxID=2867439 RepID=UPI001EF748DB|nr:flavodoxin [Listeria ilorinensis]
MRILLAYDSLSGNTKLVADEIKKEFVAYGHDVTDFRVSPLAEYPLDEEYDLYVLGAWTVDYGRTPEDMKDFIAELEIKPEHVALFGTGETQWGVEFFCGAVDRMQKYFGSTYPTLKIEQMPHTKEDAEQIKRFVQEVLDRRGEVK